MSSKIATSNKHWINVERTILLCKYQCAKAKYLNVNWVLDRSKKKLSFRRISTDRFLLTHWWRRFFSIGIMATCFCILPWYGHTVVATTFWKWIVTLMLRNQNSNYQHDRDFKSLYLQACYLVALTTVP